MQISLCNSYFFLSDNVSFPCNSYFLLSDNVSFLCNSYFFLSDNVSFLCNSYFFLSDKEFLSRNSYFFIVIIRQRTISVESAASVNLVLPSIHANCPSEKQSRMLHVLYGASIPSHYIMAACRCKPRYRRRRKGCGRLRSLRRRWRGTQPDPLGLRECPSVPQESWQR